MAKYKCLICNEIIEIDNIDEIDACPICGVGKEYLEITEEERTMTREELLLRDKNINNIEFINN